MVEPRESYEGAAGVAIDVLLAVDEIARIVTSATSVADVLASTADGARRITGAPFVAVALYDNEGRITHWEHRGIPADVERGIGEPPIGRGLLRVPLNDESIRLIDLREHNRFRGFPRHHPEMGPFLGVVAKLRGNVSSRIYAAREPGGEPFVAADEAAIRTLGRHAAIALQNAATRELLDQNNEYLRAVREIGGAIASSRELASVGKSIVDGAVAALGADAAILLLEVHEGTLQTISATGDAILSESSIPIAGTTVGRVVVTGLPVFLEDVAREARDGRAWLSDRAMASVLLAPVRSRLGPRGVIAVGYVRHTVPSPGMQDAFYALAELGSVAVDNARAIEQERELVLLKDRERIGMDLHDTALQEIFAMGMQLQLAQSALAENPADASVRIEQVLSSLTGLNESIRDYIGTLSLARDDDGSSVSDLLNRVARDVERLLDVAVDTEAIETDIPLPTTADRVSLSLLVREALVNAHVHGRAKRVQLKLRRDGETVLITVADDGMGFDVEAGAKKGHYGLQNMHDRAASMGARFQVESSPGAGTRVKVRFPT